MALPNPSAVKPVRGFFIKPASMFSYAAPPITYSPVPPPPPYAACLLYPPPYYGGPVVPTPAVHVVQLRSVTAANFAAELDLIGSLLQNYPYIVVDTEYPGTVHRPPAGRRDDDLSPDEWYAMLKANVDELPPVQLGITLCDSHGNLPVVLDYGYGYTEGCWEVELSDFDIRRHRHAAQSVAFLRSQGVDFDAVRARGVGSAAFGAKLAEILLASRGAGVGLTWVAFGGAYDLAYLVKMIGGIGQPLPETRQGFLERVRVLLGGRVFDARFMAENCGRADLRDVGLRSVAINLGAVMPAADLPWLAGPKSLIVSRIHTIMKLHVLSDDDTTAFQGIIDRLY